MFFTTFSQNEQDDDDNEEVSFLIRLGELPAGAKFLFLISTLGDKAGGGRTRKRKTRSSRTSSRR